MITENEYAPPAFVDVEDKFTPSTDILTVSLAKNAPVSFLERLPETLKGSPSRIVWNSLIVSVVPTAVRACVRTFINYNSILTVVGSKWKLTGHVAIINCFEGKVISVRV